MLQVHIALRMLNISPSDVLFDLGCGDGRLLLEASVLYGIRAVGVEYDSSLCEKARQNISLKAALLNPLPVINHGNVLDISFEVRHIYLFLLR